MSNTTNTTETPATSRMRELANRYSQTALDLEHPLPHWNLDRERRLLAAQRTEFAAMAEAWRAEQFPGDQSPRTEAAIDAFCSAARTYFAERAKYLIAPGRADYTACAAAWKAVEVAARF